MVEEGFDIRKDKRYERHAELVKKYLPDINRYGYFSLISYTIPEVEVSVEKLKSTFLNPEKSYSQAVNLSHELITHPSGYTKPYIIKSHKDEKITEMTTCYMDGFIVSDGYIDFFCEENDGFNPNWFIYMMQRHLQLSKEVLENLVDEIIFAVIFENLEQFKWEIYFDGRISDKKAYIGYSEDISSKVKIGEIHGRDKWNIKMKIVEDYLVKVARIFGLDGLPQPYWNDKGELDYPLGFSYR